MTGDVLEGRLDIPPYYYGETPAMLLVPSWPTTAGPPPEPLDLLEALEEFEGHHIRITVEVLR